MDFIKYFVEHYRGQINQSYNLSLCRAQDGDILTITSYALFRAQIDNYKDKCEVTVARGYPELLRIFKDVKASYKKNFPKERKKIIVRFVQTRVKKKK